MAPLPLPPHRQAIYSDPPLFHAEFLPKFRRELPLGSWVPAGFTCRGCSVVPGLSAVTTVGWIQPWNTRLAGLNPDGLEPAGFPR